MLFLYKVYCTISITPTVVISDVVADSGKCMVTEGNKLIHVVVMRPYRATYQTVMYMIF